MLALLGLLDLMRRFPTRVAYVLCGRLILGSDVPLTIGALYKGWDDRDLLAPFLVGADLVRYEESFTVRRVATREEYLAQFAEPWQSARAAELSSRVAHFYEIETL